MESPFLTGRPSLSLSHAPIAADRVSGLSPPCRSEKALRQGRVFRRCRQAPVSRHPGGCGDRDRCGGVGLCADAQPRPHSRGSQRSQFARRGDPSRARRLYGMVNGRSHAIETSGRSRATCVRGPKRLPDSPPSTTRRGVGSIHDARAVTHRKDMIPENTRTCSKW